MLMGVSTYHECLFLLCTDTHSIIFDIIVIYGKMFMACRYMHLMIMRLILVVMFNVQKHVNQKVTMKITIPEIKSRLIWP